MAMNFDTYSTSFQSLMKPMYNVNANYTIGAGGYPGAAGMIGGGYMNPAMMGMYAMGPMANVGVGQFSANYLLQGEDQLNNYYARPVAVHKKENETGTILGILATALGTAAMLAALAKGRFKRTPGTTPPAAQTPPAGQRTYSVTPNVPGARRKTGNTGAASSTQNTTTNKPNSQRIAGYLPSKPSTTNNTAASAPINGTPAANPQIQPAGTLPLGLPAPGATSNPAAAGNPALPPLSTLLQGQNLPLKLPNTTNIPAAAAQTTSSVAGYLPAPAVSSRMQYALNKQAAAMNLPSSGNVITTPMTAQQYTAAGMMTPEAQAAYNRVLSQQFKPGLAKEAARADARAAFASTPKRANDKLIEVRPDLAKEGSVVYTTHTPESIANGYSLGSNAKGADKLAELLAQMKA